MLKEEQVLELLKDNVRVSLETQRPFAMGSVTAIQEILEISDKELDEIIKIEKTKIYKF